MDGTHVAVVQPPPDEPYPKHDVFGLQDMWRLLMRRHRIVWGVFSAVLLTTLAYAALRPPVYQATALMMMSPSEPRIAGPNEQDEQKPDNGYVESQVEILRSPALALQLVDRLRLSEDREFTSAGGRYDRRRLQAASAVASAIEINRRAGTYIVEVTVKSRRAEKAARMANALVALYFDSRAQARLDYANQTSQWMGARLAELRNEVQARETEVEQYRAAHGLLMVQGDNLNEQQMRDAEGSLVAARMDLAERQARYEQVRAVIQGGGSADTMAGTLSSETMAALRARQADVTRRLADYNERYGDLHPAVLTARAELADINRQIEAEVGRIAQSLGNEAAIARARVATLQGHLASVRGQLVGGNAEQVRLRELERNATAARSVYESFLLRFNEVSTGAAGLGGDAQVVTNASTPNQPAHRSTGLLLLFAAVLGLAAGALAAFLVEQFTTTLQTSEDVEKMGVPLLTSIPLLNAPRLRKLPSTERHPAGFVAAKPMSAFAEAIRMLRAKIAHAGYSQNVRVVAMTSALPGEGKSSTALSLARVAALSGRKVILVDCDLRRRSLNHLLCIEPTAGVLQVLHGEVNWRNVAGRDEPSGAHVLPAAGDAATAEDVFSTEAMRTLLRELSDAYELVILDCAPVLTLAEVRDLAAMADGVVLVARRNKTARAAVQTAINELRATNATILGVAFNGVDVTAPGRVSYADPLYFNHSEKDTYFTS
ncbi:GumC family protein [Terricaulis sp.]|uniref:GumC family protein n=1 Tax=Terricaulis sp. TaxID=2768686 RepID=UPI0037832A60